MTVACALPRVRVISNVPETVTIAEKLQTIKYNLYSTSLIFESSVPVIGHTAVGIRSKYLGNKFRNIWGGPFKLIRVGPTR